MSRPRTTPTGLFPSDIYVGGKRNDMTHIASHKPTGYGVRALCGASWREGDYRTVSIGPNEDIMLCRRCEKASWKARS